MPKLKALVGKFGYHEVVSNFEHSPLFKSYIDTGLKILEDQTSFESLDESTTMVKYLSREEFERVVDLLRQLQAG
jgi:hypothetical protein